MSQVHWTYKDDSLAPLEQGDLLSKTDYIVDLLKQYHPYYANHPHNQFFIVLTQSCDLVVRGGGAKSEYIALAPVRPLRVLLEREFAASLRNRKAAAQPYASKSTRGRYEDILTKIFNNNYDKYFFLEHQPDRGLSENMCAVLPLSISLKAEHYDELLKARFLQLSDTFQAKLGYLVGKQFSKVGTQDWTEAAIASKVAGVVEGMAVWVDDSNVTSLNRAVSEFETSNPGQVVDSAALAEMIAKIPSRKDSAIETVFALLEKQQLLPAGPSKERFNLRKMLNSDPNFAQFFRTN